MLSSTEKMEGSGRRPDPLSCGTQKEAPSENLMKSTEGACLRGLRTTGGGGRWWNSSRSSASSSRSWSRKTSDKNNADWRVDVKDMFDQLGTLKPGESKTAFENMAVQGRRITVRNNTSPSRPADIEVTIT
jgi:hypothetical protein